MSRSQLAGIEAFDVVHLHFLAHAFDLPNLFDMLNKRQKLVWTLHDANPFTGGCHIFGNCERYVGACGCCPVLQSSQESDLSRKVHLRKTKLYSDRDLTFIGPSRWISSSCSQSSLGKPFKHVVIPHAIDADLFVPTDRAVAKTRLNVPSDRFVVGWLAASVNDPNKGLDLLISALAKLDTKKIHLLWAGAHDREMDVPYSHTKLPAMSEHSRLLDFYAASDVFAMTSRSETYGLAAAEANACGTPVVGFNCTGLPDAVAVGKLVEAFDTTNLGLAIESYAGLPCEQYEATRTEARNEAIRVNSMVDWANRHLAIYQSHA
jgi:glycosyltransferase involved in cell wall biosynthesis